MAKLSEVIIRLSSISKMKNMKEEDLFTFISKREKGKIPGRLLKRYAVEKLNIKGNDCYALSPREGKSDNAVLFIHGGAYILDMDDYHWHAVDGIIKKTSATVYVPIYPLAPEHTYIETEMMMDALYEKITKEHKRVSVIGDSAGGQIAIKLLSKSDLKAKDLILVSPLVYLYPDSELIEEMKSIEEKDIMLSVDFIRIVSKWWTKGNIFTYGDVNSIKKVSIFVGTNEILYPHALRLASNIEDCEVYEGKQLMHTWPYMPGDKECAAGFKTICDIINK